MYVYCILGKNATMSFNHNRARGLLHWMTWCLLNVSRKPPCTSPIPPICSTIISMLCPTPRPYISLLFRYLIRYEKNRRHHESELIRIWDQFLPTKFLLTKFSMLSMRSMLFNKWHTFEHDFRNKHGLHRVQVKSKMSIKCPRSPSISVILMRRQVVPR